MITLSGFYCIIILHSHHSYNSSTGYQKMSKHMTSFLDNPWNNAQRIRSKSYKNLISSFFKFSLLSLSVCRTGKYCLYIKMAKHYSKKWKKSSFYEEKSLVGLTPELIINEILEMKFVLSAKTSVTFLSVFFWAACN